MGMTIGEIAQQCEDEPSFLQDDIYLVTPIKKHPLFTYAVYVNEDTGLYQIREFQIQSNVISMEQNFGMLLIIKKTE